MLRQVFETIDDEPVLPPEDHETGAPQFVQVGLEIFMALLNRSTGGFDQVVERGGLRGACVLSYVGVEKCRSLFEL